jgi:thiol:disulfide interchange protein
MNARCAAAAKALCLAVLALTGVHEAQAQGKRSDSVVKASVAADKPGADGKQVVTITLTIDPKYYLYANPVGNMDLESSQVTLKAAGKAKLAKVDYPPGEAVKDKVVGDYKIYKDKVAIKATVQRPSGNDPVELTVTLVACSKVSCLLPGTIKLTVP